jgi:hypothetical protein
MEIHKPKPWHSWREFLKEYAIIVVGVLTALAAEQAVENWHEHSRAGEARASVHAEIARNLAYMDMRDKSEGCVKTRLDEVDVLIEAWAAGKPPQDPIWIGQPATFIMQDGKYKSAVQSGNASLFNETEQAAYADLYAIFTAYWQGEQDEMKAWADLRVLEKNPSPSATLDWQLRSAVQQARTQRFAVQLSRMVSLNDAAAIGIKPGSADNDIASACLPLNTSRDEALKIIAGSMKNRDASFAEAMKVIASFPKTASHDLPIDMP